MKKQPLWDIHHHWVNETGYIDRLLKEMDRLGIERTGLIAMGDIMSDLFIRHGSQCGAVSNEDLAILIKQHPDRFWGWGFIRLGAHQAEDVDRLRDMGMSGLKFHLPIKPYSELEYFPVYEKAAAFGMPCLFHTGIVGPPSPRPELGIRSENYRPIHLEPIAHAFPKLRLIGAHLGVCWNEEAAAICRLCPNIYFDLSGRVDGWRSSKSMAWFKEILYWPNAHRKILFGSDVHSDEIEPAIEDHLRIFRGLGWDEEAIARAMRQNAMELIGGAGQ